jgi:hypothetical protein
MSDEPAKLAEGMEAPLRERRRIENHACEHAGCGHRAPFGFARRRGHPIGSAAGIAPTAINISWEESTNDPLDLRR